MLAHVLAPHSLEHLLQLYAKLLNVVNQNTWLWKSNSILIFYTAKCML